MIEVKNMFREKNMLKFVICSKNIHVLKHLLVLLTDLVQSGSCKPCNSDAASREGWSQGRSFAVLNIANTGGILCTALMSG